MWTYNSDFNKWYSAGDSLLKSDFDFLKQELAATRYFSKNLSGATFIPINNLDDIYDILGEWVPRNWYVSTIDSEYVDTDSPSKFFKGIDNSTSYEYYTKFLSEYGMTLKNLFTADRLIKDSVKNYIQVDVATNAQINLDQLYTSLTIDGVVLKAGNRILVKDQKTEESLSSDVNTDEYFLGEYEVIRNLGTSVDYSYYNADNGIYVYDGRYLIKQADFDDYEKCVRCSVYVNMGTDGAGMQFHLKRLLSGYFPTSLNAEPMKFAENHNWLLRNRVDYNNLFEINYYDVIKHSAQSYYLDGVTYSIPERTIAVGEFGVILNTQNGVSNIITNKYKVNLRGISETTRYYWICGDDSTLLKVRKHDFAIERIKVDSMAALFSVSFYNELRGVVVGEMNTILLTLDSGQTWRRLRIDEFSSFTYYKAVFSDFNRLYVAGRNGVFIEVSEGIGGWTAYRRRISKQIDDDDEYLLVENINDLFKTTVSSWGLSYSYSSDAIAAEKELLFISTDGGNVVVHDIGSATEFDFLYLDFGKNYGDIRNITRRAGTKEIYFTGDEGLYTFGLDDFRYVGIGNSYSNSIAGTYSKLVNSLYANEIFDYRGEELLVCGNNSLLEISGTIDNMTLEKTYYYNWEKTALNFASLDDTFESRLKPKMLFLDYDMGSKLNFFTDQGEYRLPNSVTFSAPSAGFTFSMMPLVYGPTAPSYVSKYEKNWWGYYSDLHKAFEPYSATPLDASSMVLMSSTFSYYSKYEEFSLGGITVEYSDILRLAPGLTSGESHSRYSKLTGSGISLPAYTTDRRLYLKDYLAILEVATFSASLGDVIRLESDLVDANMVVNKIIATSSKVGGNDIARNLIYMYSEFNQSIVTGLSELHLSDANSIKIRNLNRFKTNDDFVGNLNSHPIGAAYKGTTQSGNVVKIEPMFNSSTSYYNLASNVVVSEKYATMSYTDGFLKFGYTPTYNLLDYMEGMNSKLDLTAPLFYDSKEYFAMPVYSGIPIGTLTASNAYIDSSGLLKNGEKVSKGNRILFGPGLKLEWESIFVNTFVDLEIYQPNASGITHSSSKMLVMSKYEIKNYDGLGIDAYAVEFHKELNFTTGSTTLLNATLGIISRRTLGQISADLQELNNIQPPVADVKSLSVATSSTPAFGGYERRLNFKMPTDSYAKVLLSDVDTVTELSALMYVDYKNELAMNITRLGKEYNVPILNTVNYGGQLYIKCKEKHGLSKSDGFVLEFNGGTYSSQSLNQNYFGYHFAKTVVNEYDFITELAYGQDIFVGNDVGYVRYVKTDPFMNYEPVDIIDVGVDKRGKRSIELGVDNLDQNGDKFSLVNVDFEKYRIRLVDGLNVETISLKYPWIFEAEVSGAVLGTNQAGDLIWYKGIWESGRWFGGNWISGTWKSGDWYGGVWDSKSVIDKQISMEINSSSSDPAASSWFTGRWYDGIWNNGTWTTGRWYGGIWNAGEWYNGIWNDGTWNSGRFIGGIWVEGIWNGGVFNTDNEPAFWIDGEWNGGDFENGMWYNGVFGEKKGASRFGLGAFNSRTATWHGGSWISGSFHSGATGSNNVSDVHKYSIWYTGQWMSGNWHGGIAYNTTFNSGTWHGGILEEIQIVGINDINKSFILNGLFRFNIGDEICVIDNNSDGDFSVFGSNSSPVRYTVLKVVQDTANRLTEVYLDFNFSAAGLSNYSKYSGVVNYSIPSTGIPLVSTQSVSYTVSGTNEIAVKINLTNNHIGDLVINLKAPNGKVINLKQFGTGGTMSLAQSSSTFTKNNNNSLVDTVFSTTQSAYSFASGSSPYTYKYKMMGVIGQGSAPYLSNTAGGSSALNALLNADGTITGDWSLYVKDSYNYSLPNTNAVATASVNGVYSVRLPGNRTQSLRIGDTLRVVPIASGAFATFSSAITGMRIQGQFTQLTLEKTNTTGGLFNVGGATNSVISTVGVDGNLIDWEIMFYNKTQVGAQINQPIANGFDTGLRVVSNFKNGDWKSGIWTNGIYDAGTFEGGIWYNGVFGADWG